MMMTGANVQRRQGSAGRATQYIHDKHGRIRVVMVCI